MRRRDRARGRPEPGRPEEDRRRRTATPPSSSASASAAARTSASRCSATSRRPASRPRRTSNECRVGAEEAAKYEVGQDVKVATSSRPGQRIDVIGTSRGRGTAGVVQAPPLQDLAQHARHARGLPARRLDRRRRLPGPRVQGPARCSAATATRTRTTRNVRVVRVDADAEPAPRPRLGARPPELPRPRPPRQVRGPRGRAR